MYERHPLKTAIAAVAQALYAAQRANPSGEGTAYDDGAMAQFDKAEAVAVLYADEAPSTTYLLAGAREEFAMYDYGRAIQIVRLAAQLCPPSVRVEI